MSKLDKGASQNFRSSFINRSSIKAIDPEEEQERRVLNMVNRV